MPSYCRQPLWAGPHIDAGANGHSLQVKSQLTHVCCLQHLLQQQPHRLLVHALLDAASVLPAACHTLSLKFVNATAWCGLLQKVVLRWLVNVNSLQQFLDLHCATPLLAVRSGHHQWPRAGAEHRTVPNQGCHPNRCSNQPRQQVSRLQAQQLLR
jgi:hypothetical protein